MTTVAVIGGTGALGSGLARRLVRAGHAVVIGSRDAGRATAAASALAADSPGATVTGLDNRAAATAAEAIVVAVPFASQAATLADIAPILAGKLVVDTTVPLVPPRVSQVALPPEGSAAAVALACLGPTARLVTAFHNVAAAKLAADGDIGCDVLVFGDAEADRQAAIDLIATLDIRALHAGPLANAVAAEALTSVLIGINRRYKIAGGAGIRVTGSFA
jgi:NADPH-dependent F420 reductase